MSTVNAILFYNPVWTVNNLIGQNNVGGYIYFYDSNNPTDLKPIYKDSGLTNEWENPIRIALNSAQDDTYTIYGTDDGPYRVVIADATNVPIETYDPFPYANTGAPIVPDQEITNQVVNGQLKFFPQEVYDPVPETIIGVAPNYDFVKNNDTATDTLSFQQLALGQTNIPSFPEWLINYTCTGPGSGETQKDLIIYLADAFAYSNTEMTAVLNAISATTDTIEILFLQNFGTGGSPSSPVLTPIATQPLTAQSTAYPFTFTVPTVSGKVLGTNDDSFTAIVIRYPLNQACNVGLTNFGFYFGAQAPIYQYKPINQTQSEAIATQYPIISFDNLPLFNPADGNFYPVLLQGTYKLTLKSLAGDIVDKGYAYANAWEGLECNGSAVFSSSYYNMVNKISTNFGIGSAGFYSSTPIGVTLTTTATGVSNAAAKDINTTMRVYTVTPGAVSVNQLIQVLCVPGASIRNSTYFLISNTTTNFYVWFNLNGTGVDPMVAAATGVPIAYTGAETAAQIAALIHAATITGITSNIPTNTITATCVSNGAVSAIQAGTSGFTVAQTSVGSGSTQATATIAWPAGSAIINGSYLEINGFGQDYYLWMSQNNQAQDPGVLSILSGKIGIKVIYIGTETNLEMAALGAQQLINSQVLLPQPGLFRRQVANGSTNDPDRDARTAIATGANSGDNVGSYQDDQNLDHNHTYPGINGGSNAGTNYVTHTSSGDGPGTLTWSNSGGNQANPRNYSTDSVILI